MHNQHYKLIRSNRKTLAIYIKPDGTVEVRAPLRLPKSEIERFLAEKKLWIAKKQAQMDMVPSAKLRELPPLQYTKSEFAQMIHELVETWEQRLGVKAAYVGIRAMTSRWGSCTAKTRRIRLNAALAYCSFPCLEYVVVHELAHLRENNHSPRFWAVVADVLPDYKERSKELKAFSWLLHMEAGSVSS